MTRRALLRELDSIDESTLRALLAADSIREVVIVRHEGAYAVKVKFGNKDVYLSSRRNEIRTYKSLDTIAKQFREMGRLIITLDLN